MIWGAREWTDDGNDGLDAKIMMPGHSLTWILTHLDISFYLETNFLPCMYLLFFGGDLYFLSLYLRSIIFSHLFKRISFIYV